MGTRSEGASTVGVDAERTAAVIDDAPARFPNGARFAFTVLDDTDDATVENVKPIYDLLYTLGFRTTKTVWPLDCPEGSALYFAGATLQDVEYLAFVRELVARGFELASHGATMESSTRERTERGLRFFETEFGTVPTVHCNHGQNLENLYWGAERYRTSFLRLPLRGIARLRRQPRYSGHVPGSPYFWGDISQQRFRFVRNFAFATLNSGALPPHGPYRLRSTPWVNYWFNTADAPDVRHFRRLVTRSAVDQLLDDGGTCILSTHLGKGFVHRGAVDPAVEDMFRYIASLGGWFVPVSPLLEHLLRENGGPAIAPFARWGLEVRHVVDRVRAHRLLAPWTGSAAA